MLLYAFGSSGKATLQLVMQLEYSYRAVQHFKKLIYKKCYFHLMKCSVLCNFLNFHVLYLPFLMTSDNQVKLSAEPQMGLRLSEIEIKDNKI